MEREHVLFLCLLSCGFNLPSHMKSMQLVFTIKGYSERTFGDGNIKTYFKLAQWYVGTLPPRPSTNYTPPEILGRIELHRSGRFDPSRRLAPHLLVLAGSCPRSKPTTSPSSVAALIHDKVILQKDSKNRQHLGIREL